MIIKGRVSIIIPAWNTAEYISHALTSCLEQEYMDLEILVINDASTDKTADVVAKFAKEDARIKLFSIEHGGVSRARNYGIAMSSGEYIVFLDSDDWIEPNTIDTLLNYYEAYSNFLVSCNAYYVSDGSNGNYEKDLETYYDSFVILSKEEALLSTRSNKYHNSSVNKMFRASVIRNNGIQFDDTISYGEDWLFTFTYLMHADGMIYVDIPLWNVYSRSGSATREKIFNEKLLTSFCTVDKMLELEIEAGCNEQLTNSIRALEVDTAIGLYRQYLTVSDGTNKEYLSIIHNYMKKYCHEYFQDASIFEKIKLCIMMRFPIRIVRMIDKLWHKNI